MKNSKSKNDGPVGPAAGITAVLRRGGETVPHPVKALPVNLHVTTAPILPDNAARPPYMNRAPGTVRAFGVYSDLTGLPLPQAGGEAAGGVKGHDRVGTNERRTRWAKAAAAVPVVAPGDAGNGSDHRALRRGHDRGLD